MNRPRLVLGLFTLCLAGSLARGAEPVGIGSKSFTESVILGELAVHLVRDAGGTPRHQAELGGTQILWKALLSGEIDVYPEYTGTLLQEIFEGRPLRTEDELRAALAEQGVSMTGRLGFSNTYALGMRADHARELGIRTISDLARHPRRGELKFSLSDEFLDRADGWPGLQRLYDLPETNVRGMDHNLAYRAIESRSADVIDLYTTDAEIRFYELVVLEDDRGYFPPYHAVLLYRSALATEQPAAAESIQKLAGRVETADMIAMNANVKLDRQPESRVAGDFLRDRLALDIPVEQDSAGSSARRLRRFLQTTREHLFLVVVSLAAAVAAAVPLGITAHRFPQFGHAILSVIGVVQTIPSMALLVFVIPFLGLGAWPAIVALFAYSLLPIVRGTYAGLQGVPPQLQEAATVLGLTSAARLRLVELPLAMPSIMAGVKTAAVINVGTATIGALIGAGGYGQPILTGIRLDDVGLILQGAVPAALLAVIVQRLFDVSERWLIPAGLRQR